MVRVAAVGTGSTGKSALLNALFGTRFPVDARSGSTSTSIRAFANFEGAELEILDTPQLDQRNAPVAADAYLLVCDKDLTYAEYTELVRIWRTGAPFLVALNKADTYSYDQRSQLIGNIRDRLQHLAPVHRIVACAADPVRIVHDLQPDGSIVERIAPARPELDELLPVLRGIIEEAKASLRVQAREYACEAADRVRSAATSGWRKLRNRT